jgi:hypothetical protein
VYVASDYPFLDVFWTMLVFVAWVVWLWILVTVLMDLFRRHDVSGWAKAAWTFFVIVLPYLGVFVYLISQGDGMAKRKTAEVQASRAAFDDYVRDVASNGGAGDGGPADQIAKAKELLDNGTIDASEFEQIKRRALAGA